MDIRLSSIESSSALRPLSRPARTISTDSESVSCSGVTGRGLGGSSSSRVLDRAGVSGRGVKGTIEGDDVEFVLVVVVVCEVDSGSGQYGVLVFRARSTRWRSFFL